MRAARAAARAAREARWGSDRRRCRPPAQHAAVGLARGLGLRGIELRLGLWFGLGARARVRDRARTRVRARARARLPIVLGGFGRLIAGTAVSRRPAAPG